MPGTRKSPRKNSADGSVEEMTPRRSRRRSESHGSAGSVAKKKRNHVDQETPETTSTRRRRSSSAGSASSSLKQRKRSESMGSTSSAPRRRRADSSVSQSSTKNARARSTPKKKPKKSPKTKENKTDPSQENVSKNPPTLDVQVHRVRNLNYLPRAITTMAHVSTKSGSFLAVARDSGSVELRTVEKLRTITSLPGFPDEVVTCMAWVKAGEEDFPTLVGASAGGNVFVIDFDTREFRSIPSNGGGVYCLASIPGSALVAAGCEDGLIRFFEVDQGLLRSTVSIPSSGAPVLSIAVQSSLKRADGLASNHCSLGTVLFAGVADGTIRRYDFSSDSSGAVAWKSTFRITLETHGRNIPTRVWSLRYLSDGTLASGDSLGHVQLWDSESGTLHQSFDQNTDKADVLSIDASSDELKIFASGIDSRVICIERAAGEDKGSGEQSKWFLSHTYRPHTHDVKAVTVCVEKRVFIKNGIRETSEKDLLVTGGVDTKLCSYLVKKFDKRRPQPIYPWPTKSPFSLAKKARKVVMLREDKVDIYRLGPKQSSAMQVPFLVEEDNHIGTIQIASRSNLSGVAVSSDASLLAVCDTFKLNLFKLKYNDEDRCMSPEKIALAETIGSCSAMAFTVDNQFIVATCDNHIHVVHKDESEDMASTVQKIKLSAPGKGTISGIKLSPCSDWFAVTHGRVGQVENITVYVKNDIGFQRYWEVPNLATPVTTIEFLSDKPPKLVVACCNFSCYVFDIQEQRLDSWSEEAGYPVDELMPRELVFRHDFPLRIAVNTAAPSKFILGSFGAFVTMDTSKKFPETCRIFPESHVRGRKRSGSYSSKAGTVSSTTCCLRYNSMLFLDFMTCDELVVIEQPWLNVVASFPEALHRKVYGT